MPVSASPFGRNNQIAMKQILIAILSALLLATPAAIASSSQVNSTLMEKKAKKTATVVFNVSMHCKNCVKKITENISFVKGVKDLKVSLEDKTVTITYDPVKTDEATLKKEIEKLGFTCTVK